MPFKFSTCADYVAHKKPLMKGGACKVKNLFSFSTRHRLNNAMSITMPTSIDSVQRKIGIENTFTLNFATQ